ncbi:hypothetical protein CONCODRAFT_18020 [Conidiobolus coronatus NRRL 28638]|uniref:F-box domain-containing protein n=1 Tax=Conidiobolus coronatus (strain ATCC 28846 / CBS 209.66 / NRRL 28638) TaxID=796925 RepID=A0A137P4H5_CONC2|nr:hypothetical protein CONCODRAFT_18020 [Conidiobolus coronatus NRRL 28638]|eukprot:KXN69918.1 hypothetical protein CONCODRAFT_18020 [Conidiobolus coronatus NRRL 28638]
MEFNHSSEPYAVAWQFLPEASALCQYLNIDELIELSKSSKRYRKQIEKHIFKNLSLTSWLRNNEEILKELKHSRNYYKLLDIVKDELGSNLNLVKKFTFKEIFSLEPASEIINLLPNLDRISFSPGYDEKEKFDLLELLSKIKNLEHAEFSATGNEENFRSYNDAIFPKSLRSLKVHVPEFFWGEVSIFDNIDSSYVNLTTLDILSNKMLKSLSSIPNLKEVRILQIGDLDNSSLIEFFKKNPQLTSLAMEYRPEDDALLQNILLLKSLTFFGIDGAYYYTPQYDSYPLNHSIKYLVLGSGIDKNIAIQLINACKGLEYVEFNCWYFYPIKNIKWDKLTQRIKYLGFVFCEFEASYIKILDNLKFFDQAKIKQCYGSQEIKDFNFGDLKNYSKLPWTNKEHNYCIIKKIFN